MKKYIINIAAINNTVLNLILSFLYSNNFSRSTLVVFLFSLFLISYGFMLLLNLNIDFLRFLSALVILFSSFCIFFYCSSTLIFKHQKLIITLVPLLTSDFKLISIFNLVQSFLQRYNPIPVDFPCTRPFSPVKPLSKTLLISLLGIPIPLSSIIKEILLFSFSNYLIYDKLNPFLITSYFYIYVFNIYCYFFIDKIPSIIPNTFINYIFKIKFSYNIIIAYICAS